MDEIDRIISFLCGDPADENCRRQAKEMLAEMFAAAKETGGLSVIAKEMTEDAASICRMFWESLGSYDACISAFGDELEDAPAFCKSLQAIAGQKPAADGETPQERDMRIEQTQHIGKEFLARHREAAYLQQRGARHVLSGFAGGPGPTEGGPEPAGVISKEAGVDIRNKIVQAVAITGGTGQVDIDPDVWVSFSIVPGWEFYRVNYSSKTGAPAGFGAGPGGYIAETNHLDECVHLIARCLGHRAVSAVGKEAKQHPLAGLYGGRPSGGDDVLT